MTISLIAINIAGFTGIIGGADFLMWFRHDEWVKDDWKGVLVEADPELGSISKSGESVRHRRFPLKLNYELEWDVNYHIEADHSRAVPARPAKGSRVALFGGSFMFGLGLSDEESIANQLQKLLPTYRVFNYAVNGHGTAQNFLYMKRVLTHETDVEFCVVGFITDHVRRSATPYGLVSSVWGRNHPVVRKEGEKLVFRGLAKNTLNPSERVHVSFLSRSNLYGRIFGGWQPTRKDFDLVETLVVEMNKICSERGGKFLFVLLPSGIGARTSLSLSEDYVDWVSALKSQGIWILNLVDKFEKSLSQNTEAREEYFFNDGHTKPNYAEFVSDEIYQTMKTLEKI